MFVKRLQISYCSPVLDKGLYQLWSQAGQTVTMLLWVTKVLTLLRHLFPCHLILVELEVKIGGGGSQKIQDVSSSIVTQDAFGLYTRAKLHWTVVVVEHLVTLDSQWFTGFIEQLQKPAVKHTSNHHICWENHLKYEITWVCVSMCYLECIKTVFP